MPTDPPAVTLTEATAFFATGGTYADIPPCPSTITTAQPLVDWWNAILDYLEQQSIAQAVYQWVKAHS